MPEERDHPIQRSLAAAPEQLPTSSAYSGQYQLEYHPIRAKRGSPLYSSSLQPAGGVLRRCVTLFFWASTKGLLAPLMRPFPATDSFYGAALSRVHLPRSNRTNLLVSKEPPRFPKKIIEYIHYSGSGYSQKLNLKSVSGDPCACPLSYNLEKPLCSTTECSNLTSCSSFKASEGSMLIEA